ncbi:hypothetical protein JST97_27190 [bacterium]|nr:hypothetical protein [bacterium]
MRKFLAGLAFCCALANPGWAQDVELGGQLLFRVDNPKLAQAINARLENLLFNGADPADLKLVTLKAGIGIYWGKLEIVVVTKELAEANSSQPKALASLWLSRLREVAEVGPLKLNPSRIELPIDGEASIDVTGLATGPFGAQDANGRVQINEDNGQLKVRARAVGKSKILITRGKARAYLFVHVKDWAGKLPDTVQVQVSGRPAPGEMVLEAVLRALMTQARVNPGCKLQIDVPNNYQAGLPSVPQGQQMNISLVGRITGSEDYYPVRKEIRAGIECISVDPVEPNLLLVSNRPEQVDKDGVLLSYTLTPKEPSRLMYSHMNASNEDRNLWVNLYNPGNEEASVLVDWSFSGPSRNEVTVGHAAAQRFLTRLNSGAGYVLTIPPNTRLELAEHSLERKELLSGFASLRMLKGSKLEVEVLSKLYPGRNDGSKVVHLGAPFNPFKIHPHGVFAQPYFEEWLELAAGGAPLSFNYGESPWLIDFESGLPNTGNFGVIYRWHVALSNPSSRTHRFGLFFTPKNGAAALSMLVNNEVVSIPFTQRNEQVGVRSFELAPGKDLNVDLTTLPEASSSYPATLEFRELQPGEASPPEYREQR